MNDHLPPIGPEHGDLEELFSRQEAENPDREGFTIRQEIAQSWRDATGPVKITAIAGLTIMATMVIAALAGLISLFSHFVGWLIGLGGDGALWLAGTSTDGVNWLTSWKLTHVITDPIHHYLTTHATGLPVTPQLLERTWAVAALILLILAFTGSWGARIGWTLIGGLTTAMAWAGSTHTHRSIAAGVTLIAWALLSVLAFRGAWRRQNHTTLVTIKPNVE